MWSYFLTWHFERKEKAERNLCVSQNRGRRKSMTDIHGFWRLNPVYCKLTVGLYFLQQMKTGKNTGGNDRIAKFDTTASSFRFRGVFFSHYNTQGSTASQVCSTAICCFALFWFGIWVNVDSWLTLISIFYYRGIVRKTYPGSAARIHSE